MKATKKITMTKKEKDTIINGLDLLLEYEHNYEEIFGTTLAEDYGLSYPEEFTEAFKNSLNSSYIDIIKN